MLVKFVHAETGEEVWVNPYQVRTIRGDRKMAFIAMNSEGANVEGGVSTVDGQVIPVRDDVTRVVQALDAQFP